MLAAGTACRAAPAASARRAAAPAPSPRRHLTGRPRAPLARSASESPSPSLPYKHLLLTILDANSYLSSGSKLSVATATQLASLSAGKVTVLVVDEKGTTSTNPRERIDAISWHFNDKAFANYQILEKNIETPASVLIGDVADEIEADLVLLSSEAVHAKHVDANQLAEFVSCPVLLLP